MTGIKLFMKSTVIFAILFFTSLLIIPMDSFAEGMWSGVLQSWRGDKIITEWEFLNAVGYLHDQKIIQYEDGERNIVAGRDGLDLNDPEFSYNDHGQMSHPIITIYAHDGYVVRLDDYGQVTSEYKGQFISSWYCDYCHILDGN